VATQKIEIVAVDKTQKALRSIEQNTNRMGKAFGVAGTAAKAFIAAIAVDKILDLGRAVKNATAEFQNQQNQLKLITKGTADLARVTDTLRSVAIENRVAFGDTVELFTKLTLATQEMGVSEEQVIDVTGKLSQALAVAGADAATTSSVIRQFGQAMASGTVRGDEFNSIVEGLGPALIIMARETGVNIGKLREMSRSGQLSAQVLFEMLENSNALTAAFQQMDPTIDQLETGLKDAFDAALIKLGEVTGFTKMYENTVKSLTRTFQELGDVESEIQKASIAELVNNKDLGTAQARLAELEHDLEHFFDTLDKIEELKTGDAFDAFGLRLKGHTQTVENLAKATGFTVEELVLFRDILEELAETEKKVAEENKKAAEAEQARAEAMRKALKPFKDSLDLARKYEASGFGSALEKNEQKIKAVEQALLDMKNATVISNIGQQEATRLTNVLTIELAHLTEQNKKLKEAQNEVIDSTLNYADFMEELTDSMDRSVTIDNFKKKAITEISAQYRGGALTLQQYETAMKSLDSSFKTQAQREKELAEANKKASEDRQQTLAELTEKYRTHFMTQIQLIEDAAAKEKQTVQDLFIFGEITAQKKQSMELQIERATQDKITAIRLAAEKKRSDELQKMYDKNLQAFRAGKFGELKTAEMTEKQKVSFIKETGVMALNALGQHSKEAFQLAKAAAIAEAIINTAQGVTKALAQGGIFGPLLAGVIVAAGAAQIATIKSQKFQGRQRGGAVAAGQSVITGEDGPELIVPKQPSTVIPREVAEAIDGLGGRSQPVTVNFNINTVDARDFDDLLIERRGTITGIINNAMRQQGRMGVV